MAAPSSTPGGTPTTRPHPHPYLHQLIHERPDRTKGEGTPDRKAPIRQDTRIEYRITTTPTATLTPTPTRIKPAVPTQIKPAVPVTTPGNKKTKQDVVEPRLGTPAGQNGNRRLETGKKPAPAKGKGRKAEVVDLCTPPPPTVNEEVDVAAELGLGDSRLRDKENRESWS